MDGRTEYEGRVEVCQDGLWGSVCDDGWLPVNNAVVCRQAGINATGNAHCVCNKHTCIIEL